MKALVLSFLMVMSFALPMSAQRSDDFFKVDEDFSGTRDAITYWTAANGISNNGIGQSEAPVGSGLLILTAVGAGYAVARRRRNLKNGATLLLAFALFLGMTQCKKNVETITPVANTNTVRITLNVDGGSRANVVPGDEFATVTFEEGDVIYVGYNNACLGSLTYNAENQKFGGDVAFVVPAGDDSPLQFYFLGNKTPVVTETTKYTVDIIDQTSKYPVISYNHSNEVYEGAGEYTANLFNYCSFMKFTTDNIADINSQALCITGMNNTVTVDFNGNTIEYGSIDNGLIKMPTSGSNVRWAIVLPQEELAAGSYGSLYTPNEYFKGSRPVLDEIERNEYLKAGKELKLYDVRFSISSTQKVLFSPGNLVKTDALYEVGSGNESYEFETTPFNINGGSLGYNQGDLTSTSARGYFSWSEIATANETPRDFTVNGVTGWKAMTFDEWNFLYFDGRTMNSGVNRYYIVDLGSDGDQIGFLLPPDEATSSDVEDLEEDKHDLTENVNLETYISKGFVFLPASGYCSVGYMGTYWDEAGESGYYWYTTEDEADSDNAYYLYFYDCSISDSGTDNKSNRVYFSVRLVRSVE